MPIMVKSHLIKENYLKNKRMMGSGLDSFSNIIGLGFSSFFFSLGLDFGPLLLLFLILVLALLLCFS
jgi:uncharacterized membrane protein